MKINKSLGMATLAAVVCLASASSMAFQQHGAKGHKGAYQAQSRGHQNEQGGDRDEHSGYAGARQAPHPQYQSFHDRGRHEGWYKRGGHVPAEYRRGSYVVTDWRSRRLREPPRGYEYVRSDNGEYLLIAAATGLIASIIAGN
jgi:Ni/Co efflux regulator RcnB